MTPTKRSHRSIRYAACLILAGVAAAASGQPTEPVWTLAQKEKPALIATLKDLVEIESGSRDLEGLETIAQTIAARLERLGGVATLLEPEGGLRGKVGKMVQAKFTGTGTKNILLLAHMDTVYPRGTLAKQPFRLDGDRAWGLGIADDRHGIAVILHALAVLNAIPFRDYGTLTVLITGDEEIGSRGSRGMLGRLGSEHDAVLSFERGGDASGDFLRLATSGGAGAWIDVRGRASHAGSAPELGVNALYEMAHQVLQARDLSEPEKGIKLNWTMANAGVVTNMIPPEAVARGDVRVERVEDLDAVEQKLRERIQNKLLPESEVTLRFVRGRPPLHATEASRALAAHAQTLYREIGRSLTVLDRSTGGGTDAAYAALKARGPVIEGLGLHGFGNHSTNNEYVVVDSIEPRLYLAARLIMDISQGKAPLAGQP